MSKIIKRRLYFGFAFMFLITTILTTCPFSVAASAEAPQRLGEIVALREENVRAYRLDNGQIQCDVYPVDIYYRDANGNLKDIDNSIDEAVDREGYVYTNTANSWHAYFKESINDDNAVKIEKDKYSIEFSLRNANDSVIEKSDSLLDPTCEIEKILSEDNRAVIYRNVFNNVDIAYTVYTSVLKEDIILRDKSAVSTFEFTIKANGLTIQNHDGQTTFVDENDCEIFAIHPMFMEDANGKISNEVNYSIKESADGYSLTVIADREFINAADTVFPIRIDPTYDTQGSSYTSDTYVANGDGYTGNHYLDPYNRTGKTATRGVRRTLIRFKLPSGYRVGTGTGGDGIIAATLKMKLYDKGTGTNNVRAYLVDDYWNVSEVDWGEASDLGTRTQSSVATISDNWYSMDVLDPIRNIYYQYLSGTVYSNYGFLMKDDNETTTSIYANFYSSDSGYSSYLPILSITYEDITAYQTFGGIWLPSGIADDLDIYVYSSANTNYGSAINAVWNLWNGVDADFNIDSKSTSGSPEDYEIDINTDDDLPYGAIAITYFYNQFGQEVHPWEGDSWNNVIIYLNDDSGDPGYLGDLHLNLQKEVILHELGHAAGLAHVDAANNDSSVCIMSQLIFYCYPATTSHDRQTLNSKY